MALSLAIPFSQLPHQEEINLDTASCAVRPPSILPGCVFSVERFLQTFCNRQTPPPVVPVEADRKQAAQSEEHDMNPEIGMAGALFGFLAVGAIALFTMISIASWSDARRKEREAYYKNDMLKKLAESQGPGVNSAIELLREQDRIGAIRARQGLKIGGMVMVAIGLGLLVFLRALITDEPIYLCGLLVLLIGVALFGSSWFVHTAAE
jgi:hypothetical protein